MKRRDFITKTGVWGVGISVLPIYACSSDKPSEILKNQDEKAKNSKASVFSLPALGFEYAALEPYIDAQTMEIHHSKHHAGYVKKLNAALSGSTYESMSLNEILASITGDEKDTAVRNNAGGHYNHSLYWEVMSPGGANAPMGELKTQIEKDFGSLEEFYETFTQHALGVFGSGWAWLSVKNNKLFVSHTPNQDNPMMKNIVEEVGTPILGIDVWEHAYYLKHQNLRNEYVEDFMQVINWDAVGTKFNAIS